MIKPEKLTLARDALWNGLSFTYTGSELVALATAAYPEAKTLERLKSGPTEAILHQLALHSVDDAEDLIDVLLAVDPGLRHHDDGEAFYSFEMVGANLLRFRRTLQDLLNQGVINEDRYLSIYQKVSQFSIYQDGKAEHCLLDNGHLKALFQGGHFDAFDAVYREFTAKQLPNSVTIFMGNEDLMKPFYEGRMSLHQKVMGEVAKIQEVDRFSVQVPTRFFWKGADALVAHLEQKKDTALWKEGLRIGSEVFGLQRYTPLKKAVENGDAFAALKGQVALFLAAKRQGYRFAPEEVRVMLEPVERLAKTIGPQWTKSLPLEIGRGMGEVVEGLDKKEILKGKRSKNLIQSLNELMPNAGWMNFSQQKDRRAILESQLDL